MESSIAIGKILFIFLFFALIIVRLRGEVVRNETIKSQNHVDSSTKPELIHEEKRNKIDNDYVVNKKSGGGGGGWRWGGGGGGGGGSGGGGGGWGWGGGGGGYWRWGCGKKPTIKRDHRLHKKIGSGRNEEYKIGEFAQCMARGRCMWMRLDCPLHCGGRCFYDCKNMCKAHCKR